MCTAEGLSSTVGVSHIAGCNEPWPAQGRSDLLPLCSSTKALPPTANTVIYGWHKNTDRQPMLTSSGAHSCQCSSGSDSVLCLSLSLLMQTLYWSWWLVVILSGSKPVEIFQLNSPSGNPHFRSSDVFTVTSFAILPSFPWPTPQPPRKNKGNWSSEAMSEEEPLGGRFITYPCNLLQYSFRFDFSIACPR